MPGIYIHIPFCRQACNYCNFHFTTSLRKREVLLPAICREIVLCKKDDRQIDTIYFGGGTPSILTVKETDELLAGIGKHFSIDTRAEITLEANPDDISDEKLQGWKAIGINRLSMGVQSFFDQDLRWMNRAHNARQAIDSLKLALLYFENITIDLIYGLPLLTHQRWAENMNTAIGLGIPHLSCYALTVEPRTPLRKLIGLEKKQDVDAAHQSEQFLMLTDRAGDAGYEHYEISNFAKPGFRSRHNTSYWQGKSYYGFGPAAHSYNGNERSWNVANNQKYIDAIGAGKIPSEKEILTVTQQFNEYVMTALRTSEGICLNGMSKTDKDYLVKASEKYVRQNLLQVHQQTIKLTRQGKLFADGIAADLFKDEEKNLSFK